MHHQYYTLTMYNGNLSLEKHRKNHEKKTIQKNHVKNHVKNHGKNHVKIENLIFKE